MRLKKLLKSSRSRPKKLMKSRQLHKLKKKKQQSKKPRSKQLVTMLKHSLTKLFLHLRKQSKLLKRLKLETSMN